MQPFLSFRALYFLSHKQFLDAMCSALILKHSFLGAILGSMNLTVGSSLLRKVTLASFSLLQLRLTRGHARR